MRLKIDHRTIRVEGMPDDGDARGLFHNREGVIQIEWGQPADEQAETLIHEILHAIWASRQIQEPIDEEGAVSQLASGLATVLRDNPRLAPALISAFKKGKPIVTEPPQD